MKSISTYLFPLFLALCSCVRETPFGTDPGAEGRIGFQVSIAPVPATRGEITLLHADNGPDIEAFLRPMAPPLQAPATKGSPVTEMYTSFRFLSDDGLRGTAVSEDGILYRVDGLQYFELPRDEGNRFFCWAPDDGAGITLTEEGRIRYAAPSRTSDQPDLLVALTPEMGRLDKGPTPLTFHHALAGLEVQAGTVFPGCTVQSVTLSGIVTEGEYDPWNGIWNAPEDVSDLVLTDGPVSASANTLFTGGEATAMLIPQTFAAGAAATVVLTYDTQEFTYVIPLEGLSLREGCILTLGLGCRSMYLFEGTASADFSVYYFKGVVSGTSIFKICDVPVEEDGSFSVLVPALDMANIRHSYSFARNANLLTVTRLPDILSTRQSFQRMFQGCTALKGIYCDIPSARATNWAWAFYNCSSLEDLPASLHTSACTDFSFLFFGCRKLTRVPELETDAGLDFTAMLQGCSSLAEAPDLSFPRGTTFDAMLRNCSALTSIPAYQMPRGTSFSNFCSGCTSLQSVPLLGTAAGTDFSGMFSGCSALTDVAPIDTGNGKNFSQMFLGCSRLGAIPFLNTARGTSFREMFADCALLDGVPALNTSSGATFYAMFRRCRSLTTCPELDTSNGTVFYGMFEECSSLTESRPYDTSKGTSFERMFRNCRQLSRVDNFDVSSGTAFDHMFFGCSALESVPRFNFMARSTNRHMFDGCSALTAVPDWNWSAMTTCFHMFAGCSSLAEIVGPVGTSSCTSFTQMFKGCSALRRITVMDVGNMVDGSALFQDCVSLEEVPAFYAPEATDIQQMFDGCVRLAHIGGASFPKAENWFAVFRECRSLTVLPVIDCSSATSLNACFQCAPGRGSLESLPAVFASNLATAENVLTGQVRLTDFGGFTGIHIPFGVSDCVSLTRESLLALIDGLAPVSQACALTLGSRNKGLLTDAEIQIATDKGWTVL